MLVASQGVVQAQTTFTVTKTADTNDGVCDADCSLREAITAANALAGTDTIAFNITTSDLGFNASTTAFTIQPASGLPTITNPVIIDGFTQPGASPNTNPPGSGINVVLKIELDGINAGSPFVNGLRINAGNSTIRGLVINRFSGTGIRLETNDGNIVEGNFIGTDVNGTTVLSNNQGDIVVTSGSSNNTVGGSIPGARNVLFGGVLIVTNGNTVQGNFIGTDATGTVGVFKAPFGVNVKGGSNNVIGGTTAGAANVISGIDGDGVWIFGNVSGNLVQGNHIGTDVSGAAPLPNTGHGVHLGIPTGSGPSGGNNTIGGILLGSSNVIAFNDVDGIFVENGTGNAILGNSIFSNGELGIDLGADGVTPNDVGDGDSGANNLQNFPVEPVSE